MRKDEWAATFNDFGQRGARLIQAPLSALTPWTGADGKPQPFRPYGQAELEALAESIRQNGVLESIRIRPLPDGRLQIIAGHNRCQAAAMAGLTTVPALLEELDDDQAAIAMVDSNLQHRERLLPSELAFAYKEKLEAMKHQGQRADLTCSQVGNKLAGKKSSEVLAEQVGQSKNQVFRYIRLTELIPSLLDKVDAGTIGITVGVDLSYLSKGTQATLVRVLEQTKKKLKGSQAKELRDAGEDLDEAIISQILGIEQGSEPSFPSLTVKPDLTAYDARTVRRLKKDPAYLQGLQVAIATFTAKYLEDLGQS